MFSIILICLLLPLLVLMYTSTSYSMHTKYVIFTQNPQGVHVYNVINMNSMGQGPQNHQNASFCCVV